MSCIHPLDSAIYTKIKKIYLSKLLYSIKLTFIICSFVHINITDDILLHFLPFCLSTASDVFLFFLLTLEKQKSTAELITGIKDGWVPPIDVVKYFVTDSFTIFPSLKASISISIHSLKHLFQLLVILLFLLYTIFIYL